MTPEQTAAAAAAILERSTREQGLPLHVEDEAVLDRLAAAVAETLLAAQGGGADGP